MRLIFKAIERLESGLGYLRGKNFGAMTVRQEIAHAISLLKQDPMLVVDVGGNVGNYAGEALRLSKSVEIHVFEPSSLNVKKLRERFQNHPGVIIVPAALTNSSGSGILHSDFAGSGLASLNLRDLSHLKYITFREKETVDTMKFDSYWKSIIRQRTVDLMKIDVEGEEYNVLLGGAAAIKSIRVVQFEVGGTHIDSRVFFRDFWTFFKDNSFKMYRITPLGLEEIRKYRESHESFLISNYLTVNQAAL